MVFLFTYDVDKNCIIFKSYILRLDVMNKKSDHKIMVFCYALIWIMFVNWGVIYIQCHVQILGISIQSNLMNAYQNMDISIISLSLLGFCSSLSSPQEKVSQISLACSSISNKWNHTVCAVCLP